MQIPIIKSVSCAGTTQTNVRFCGLVETSDLADEFRFNCFYCSEVFPLEKWKKFINHLKKIHFELEVAFKVSKYVSEDHDYTPIHPAPAMDVSKPVTINNESLFTSLVDPLNTTHNSFETVILSPTFYYRPDENKTTSHSVNIFDKFDKTENRLMQAVLSSCHKETNVERINSEDKESFKPDLNNVVEQNCTEITFEYSPCEIIDLLLDNMKRYSVLWQFDDEPFNEDFYEAVEDLCKIMNDKWSLNIDNLKMRRSINRILRFYCYFFPDGNDENNVQFINYYKKCATFLPPSVNEIAYARCSHCYMCFRNDSDLKLHLFEEQKYLQWPFKCAQCKECFRECHEYEFHKRVPHYDEMFTCEPCNKTFFRRNIYNTHILEYHPKVSNEPGKYECCICNKTFRSSSNLRSHKVTHGERKYRCHLCPKTFLLNVRLMRHLKYHRKEYNYICEVCGDGFVCRSNLRGHMKKHTGEKVNCNVCNLKLRKSSLRRHLRTVHLVREGKIETTLTRKQLYYRRLIRPKPVLPIQRKCKGKMNYHCKICRISFESYKSSVEHNKDMHTDILRWPCKMCSTEFNRIVNLKCHYRKKHNLGVTEVRKLMSGNNDIENDSSDKSAETPITFENEPDNMAKSKSKTPIKSHLLQDETFFELGKIHSSTLQDEIMKAADNIQMEEVKVENINGVFSDLLQ